MTKIDVKTLKIEAEKGIEKAKNLKDLDDVFKKYLGKKGEITLILRSLKDLSEKQRKKTGKQANELKKFLEEKIKQRKPGFVKASTNKEFDVSVPAQKPSIGHLHPLTLVRREIEGIFEAMGFSVISGPEIENEWYNFDALNIPANHPARDIWDTFWLCQNELKTKNSKLKTTAPDIAFGSVKGGRATQNSKLLLRTHTSPVQIRYMEKNNPPFRIVVPGRIFRHEATDASHEINFYQVEGLMVGRDISAANFKAIIEEFLSRFFNKKIKIRLRPSFFPFVEPGFEVDASCTVCQGKGCSVCSKTGWLELMGAGMVHPNVLKAGGINPKNWQGFAFGVGMDRLAMMKYKIDDVRLFYNSDLRFLNQF